MAKNVLTESWVGIFEDALDLLLFVLALLYVFMINDAGWKLSETTMAYIATSGAGARLLARRIIRRVVELRIEKPEDLAAAAVSMSAEPRA